MMEWRGVERDGMEGVEGVWEERRGGVEGCGGVEGWSGGWRNGGVEYSGVEGCGRAEG